MTRRHHSAKRRRYSAEEIERIRTVAAKPLQYGAVKRLAVELLRSHVSLQERVRQERRQMQDAEVRRTAIPPCSAMINTGISYRELMTRIHAEAMPTGKAASRRRRSKAA